jgi:hypothetical protein
MERLPDCGISSRKAAQSACVHLVMASLLIKPTGCPCRAGISYLRLSVVAIASPPSHIGGLEGPDALEHEHPANLSSA